MPNERRLMMNDRDYQISQLKRIFNAANSAPIFKDNEKYFADGVPRIAYDDIMNYKCIIRCDEEFPQSGTFWSDNNASVIAEYKNIEELVDDGWRLD